MKIEKVILLGDIPDNIIKSDTKIDNSIIIGDMSGAKNGFRVSRDEDGVVIVDSDESLEKGKIIIDPNFWDVWETK